MTNLQAVEDLRVERIAVKDCSLSPENRPLLEEILQKYVPGLADVTLHVHSGDSFTLMLKFTPEVTSTVDVVKDAIKKLHHYLTGSPKIHPNP